MAERKHISLIYQYNDKWIGGTYYILNIIRALNTLPDIEKPFLTIYHSAGTSLIEIKAINYPQIEYVSYGLDLSFLKRRLNELCLKLFGKELFLISLPNNHIDNFYYRTFVINSSNIGKYYFWIPDFQDLYLPQFFKPRELKQRREHYMRLVNEKQPIIFSSQSACNDFNKFYPGNKNLKKVVSFVSITDSNFQFLSISKLYQKFNISHRYFIISNQFWRHKNHKIVLKAFKVFCSERSDIQLVFTGKEHDYRDPAYTDELKQYVIENHLKNVLFLGFIDRDEQLKLMSESIAIIQPSLFEGWSTVVEDAKLLNKPVICSDISVHKEQLPHSDLFFDPENEDKLVEKMKLVLESYYEYKNYLNYDEKVSDYAHSFINLF